tara:strand:+ start:257 stop:898 length:642 start_codon:yes stop_codon:yes gene_type:complete
MIKSQARIGARNNGYKYYIPEKPCAKGHNLRTVSSGDCIECKKESNRSIIEKDRFAYNARKRKERQHRLPEIALKAKQNREMESIEVKTIRLEKAKIKAVEWRLKNPTHESSKLSKNKWRRNNLGKVNFYTIKRRLAKLNRTPKWTTKEDLETIKHIYIIANQFSKSFGTEYHVDHIIPLQGKLVSGLHVPSNLQIIPATDNIKKGNKYKEAA